ncbi:MAG: hypothetical protein QF652_08760, partial [Dehalococcoidia bacterium]|nr:hypothetical protein [Dehalococcoidia bacterium]
VTRAVVGMGAPRFAVDEVPVVAPSHDTLVDFPLSVGGGIFSISCVSMGNPHAVAFINTPVDEVPLHDLGPKVEHNPMFPKSRQGEGLGARIRTNHGLWNRRMRRCRSRPPKRPP